MTPATMTPLTQPAAPVRAGSLVRSPADTADEPPSFAATLDLSFQASATPSSAAGANKRQGTGRAALRPGPDDAAEPQSNALALLLASTQLTAASREPPAAPASRAQRAVDHPNERLQQSASTSAPTDFRAAELQPPGEIPLQPQPLRAVANDMNDSAAAARDRIAEPQSTAAQVGSAPDPAGRKAPAAGIPPAGARAPSALGDLPSLADTPPAAPRTEDGTPPRASHFAEALNEARPPVSGQVAPAANPAPLPGSAVEPGLVASALMAATQQQATHEDASDTNHGSPASAGVAGNAPSMSSPAVAADARPSLTEPQLAPVVGSPDWGPALAQQLVRLPRNRDIELNLNPAELGPLKVKLSVVDSQAQVAFVSEHAGVRQALEAALPQLRTSFADSGISLGQATVGSGSGEPRPHQGTGQQTAAQRRGEPQGSTQDGRSADMAPRSTGPDARAVDTFA